VDPPGGDSTAAPARRTAAWWWGLVLSLPLQAWALHYLYHAVALRPIRSNDAPWHLVCGRIIVETGAVPRVDPLCYTSAGLDWINLNWLAQELLYRLYLQLGFDGPILLAGALLGAGLAFSALHLRARGVGGAAGLLALAGVAFALLHTQGLRPRSWTFALLPACAWLLARPDPGLRLGWRTAAALLGVLLLWNNLHGGFVYGYALLGLDALGSCLDAHRQGLGWRPRRAWLLAGVIALGLLGFGLHPHGYDALVYAATYPRALDAQLRTVYELMPIDFTDRIGRSVELLVGLGVVGLFMARDKLRARDLLVAAVFLHLALVIRRGFVPLFVLSAPWVAEAWTAVFARRGLLTTPAGQAGDRWLAANLRALPAVLAGGAVLWAALVIPRTGPGRPGRLAPPLDVRALPVDAVRALRVMRDAGIRGRVFNVYHAGGLLGWGLYPEERLIFIDGRGDLHARGPAYADYRRIVQLQEGWAERLDALDVEVVFGPGGWPLVAALRDDRGWEVVYTDPRYSILRRR